MPDKKYRTVDVAVAGGQMRVGVWEPVEAEEGATTPDILLMHGVTASHRAFDLLVPQLGGARIIAPDLRGRGRSSGVAGVSSMKEHAADMVAVLDALDSERALVIGHSMGAFAALVLADNRPDRVSNLVLIDGGLPLDVAEGLDADAVMQQILGPTAERLAMKFESPEDYIEFWRAHPGLGPYWTDFLDEYFHYDLEGEPGKYHAATRYDVARDDTYDLYTGTDVTAALKHNRVKTYFLTCPRGLQDETPGLYSAERTSNLLDTFVAIKHHEIADVNHYTIVMSETGAQQVANFCRSQSLLD